MNECVGCGVLLCVKLKLITKPKPTEQNHGARRVMRWTVRDVTAGSLRLWVTSQVLPVAFTTPSHHEPARQQTSTEQTRGKHTVHTLQWQDAVTTSKSLMCGNKAVFFHLCCLPIQQTTLIKTIILPCSPTASLGKGIYVKHTQK